MLSRVLLASYISCSYTALYRVLYSSPLGTGPRRMSEAQLRTLFSEARGWRIVDLCQTWYERPAGARTMAWWCTHRPREAARVSEWPLVPWYRGFRTTPWTMAWWCTVEAV